MRYLIVFILFIFSSHLCLALDKAKEDLILQLTDSIQTLQDFKTNSDKIMALAAAEAKKLNASVSITSADQLWELTAYYQLNTMLKAAQGGDMTALNQQWDNFSRLVHWDNVKIDLWADPINKFYHKIEKRTPIAQWSPFVIRYFSLLPQNIFKKYRAPGQMTKCQFYFDWGQFDLNKKCLDEVWLNFEQSHDLGSENFAFSSLVRYWMNSENIDDVKNWLRIRESKIGQDLKSKLAHMFLAQLLGNYDEAIKYYNLVNPELKKKSNLFVLVQRENERLLIEKGQFEQAQKNIKERISIEPTNGNIDRLRGDYLLLTRISILKKNWQEAFNILVGYDRPYSVNNILLLRVKSDFNLCVTSKILKNRDGQKFCDRADQLTSELSSFNGTDWYILDLLKIMKSLKSPSISSIDRNNLVSIQNEIRKKRHNSSEIILLDALLKTH